jgi:MoaA/NifB/PqqE/SkfB family radical SAM enzyme
MKLPQSVCFRVTRACNARCGFCLAPWDGNHPREEVLAQRLAWLLENGVRAVDFCGGEPTIHPALPRLIEQVHAQGARTRLTTNGIALPPPLLETLKRCHTHVKVSLHGERAWHDRVVGLEAFDKATATLRRLCQAGVRATVQTTLVAGGSAALPAMAGLCARLGVRRLTVMPFIPRGRGAERESEFALSAQERTELVAGANLISAGTISAVTAPRWWRPTAAWCSKAPAVRATSCCKGSASGARRWRRKSHGAPFPLTTAKEPSVIPPASAGPAKRPHLHPSPRPPMLSEIASMGRSPAHP